ncbi:ATP-dependent RNA helicase HrpA [Shewanella litorisediminis]|uniref:ATP-dependent RNA helicase HrpA n=1 Tax=Shewanella litorisediminis TaxID=1173586 RepID=A0ABX7G7M4_9GAMM|nr:ATP-dependent RNA helicase HrpA [Shewanella litorisediminis]MCL2919730.1 ATP-dependent RNA helicase HrpA [Shewanella litorisediminis]QRH03325.1 ATP-dependent RNA helicase HrpA [Shewanella litorisediminis]
MSAARHTLSRAYLQQCYQSDVARIRRELRDIERLGDEAAKAAAFERLAERAEAAKAKVDARLSARPRIQFPDNLPVSQKRDDIAEAIANHQVVIVAGETGSGKTTQLPKICLELGRGSRGLIGHTQPRRLAARSVATRVAEELQSPLGEAVGFKVRFADAINENSYIKLMTDGILLAELSSDKYLNQYDTLIIDEAHERSLNIDFILGYLKQLLPRRPDLKVIITSATIDVDRFSTHFDNAPVIEVSGRTYPVETRYRPLVKDDEPDLDLMDGIFEAVDELMAEGPGDILIFMNGEREIRDTAEQLSRRQYRDTEVLPLYARLSYGEQSKVFKSHTGRRIVLATNVAETSLTVPGIRYVIDPGTARISRYSYRTKVQRLPIEPISQASANQRQGRCGRVGPGICIRLYEETDFLSRPEFTDPEILRTNLASVILQMLAIGLGDIEGFPFIQPPDERHIKDGFLLLEELQAIKLKKGLPQMTPLGRKLAHVPLDPRLARMVIEAADRGALHEALVVTSALSIQDPRERPLEKKQAADEAHSRFADKDSDFVSLLNLWNYIKEQQKALSASQFRKLCKQEYLAYLRVREWQDLYTQVRQSVHELKLKLNSVPADYDSLHRALLSGLLSHIGFKDNNNEYLGARNRRFYVFPGSPLAKKGPKWIVAAELTETSRLFARGCAKIEPEWLEELATHLIKKQHNEPHFEANQGAVVAFENQVLYGLTVVNRRKVQYGPINATEAREIFIRSALAEGQLKTREAFFLHNQKLLEEVESLEHKSRRRDILVDEQVLFDFYNERLPEGIYNAPRLFSWWKEARRKQPELLNFNEEMLYARQTGHVSKLDFPDVWHQGNLSFALSYHFEPGAQDDGVSVHIPVALLNQVEDNGFDYLVPGLREEKCVALIKSLPKSQRRNFVPAPDYARAAVQAMSQELPLLDSLAKQLLRMTGTRVSSEDFVLTELPRHLLMHFKIEDDHGKLVGEGRDLDALKANLQGVVAKAIRQVAKSGIEQAGLTEWSIEDLPAQFQRKKGNYEVKAFPALVDEKDSVAVKLFDDEHQAQKAHARGVRRLLLINIPSPVKHLQQALPNKAKLAMYFNPFGQVQLLIDDIIDAAVAQILDGQRLEVRSKAGFDSARDAVRADLNSVAEQISLKVEQILTLHNQIKKRLKGKISLDIAFAMSDIQTQLDRLVYKGFVADCGHARLSDIIRFLKAIEHRLEKLPVDPVRDKLQLLSIHKVEQALEAQLGKVPKSQPVPEHLLEARWLIEELRVSLFAQVLGTSVPISEKRVLLHIQQ